MRRRTPTIATKLAAHDHIKFDQFCRLEGKTKTEVAREAIRCYMKLRESELVDEQQSALEKRLLKMENRLASLLCKTGSRYILDGASSLVTYGWRRSRAAPF